MNPPPNRFIDPSPMRVDALPHYDLSVFHDLSDFRQIEPIQPAGAAMVGALARLGIEKGKLFRPDAATAAALTEAAKRGYAMLQQDFFTVGPAMIPYWPGSEWTRINVPQSQLEQGFPFFAAGRTLVDERAQYFFWIFGTFKRSAIPLPVLFDSTPRSRWGAF